MNGYYIYEYHKRKLLLNIPKKINLKRSDKHVALSNLSIYYKWRNFKKSYKNLKKNEELELLGGLYSVSNIQDYFEYILKKNGEKIDNPWIRIYVNKRENRTTFKIKTGYFLKPLTPETIKLFGSKQRKITKDKNNEDMSNLEIT